MKLDQLFSISFQSILNNKLRTSLTILGVVVGIFSIIVIMTIITMLQNSIEDGLAMLSKNTFQIQKFDAMQGPNRDRSQRNRKDLTIEEANKLKELLTEALYVGVEQWEWGKIVKYGNLETNPNTHIGGQTVDAMRTNDFNVEYGRDFRESDIQYSADVCILGQEIVEKIFPNMDPINQIVRVDNKPLRVIGVMEKQPEMFGESHDNYVLIPLTTWQSMYGKYGKSVQHNGYCSRCGIL
ncbi:MAG: ABC transporter permease [Ignavibacteriales bacterium]|nr:ABC transporter permease [Ignavibacteriales bacterium]